MKKMNRTVLGIICIIAAFALTFAVSPLINKVTEDKVEVVWVNQTIKAGSEIKSSDVEVAKIGKHGLKNGYIVKKEDVVGKYANTDIYTGVLIYPEMLSDENTSFENVAMSLNGDKVAISIALKGLESSYGGKIKNNDVVSIVADGKIASELTYVKVIGVITSDGFDVEGGSTVEELKLPSVVTFLANREQAKIINTLGKGANISLALVYRSNDINDENIKTLLDAQDKVFVKDKEKK